MNLTRETMALTTVGRCWRPILFFALWYPMGALADFGSLTEIHRIIPGYEVGSDTEDMPVADFDGDGRDDVVILGGFNETIIVQIAGLDAAQTWQIKQTLIPGGSPSSFNFPTLTVWTEEDGPHLLVSRNRDIYEYTGWPLTLVRTRTLPGVNSFSDLVVADVNNDGIRELIVSSTDFQDDIQAYDLQTNNLLWEVPGVSQYRDNLLVAQLDGDPALEILTGSGYVIDGATHAIEWHYKDGFGNSRATGRFAGLQPQFVALSYRLTMFQSSPWSPLWDTDTFNSSGLAIADLDGDNIDEVIFIQQNTFPTGVQVFDVQMQQVRDQFEIPNAIRLAAADFDADGDIEIAASTDPDFYNTPAIAFQVIDGATGVNEHTMTVDAPGPYVIGGFVEDAQSIDVIFGTAGYTYASGVVTRADPVTGDVRWKTPSHLPGDPLPLYSARSLSIAGVAGHSDPVILVASDRPYGITALDALDGSVLWGLGETNNGGLPQYPYPEAIAAVDENADGLAETAVVCTSERMYQFRLDTQAPVWSSVAMASSCIDVMAINSGSSLIFVAVLRQALRAYDSQSHLLLWSLPAPDWLDGASYIAEGESGPEFALFYQNLVTIYDANTRAFLRQLVLPVQTLISAVSQPPGSSIHQLIIAHSGKLHVVDGISGAESGTSEYLGENIGLSNRVSSIQLDSDQPLIVSGSEAGVFSHRLEQNSDAIFANGFDPSAP